LLSEVYSSGFAIEKFLWQQTILLLPTKSILLEKLSITASPAALVVAALIAAPAIEGCKGATAIAHHFFAVTASKILRSFGTERTELLPIISTLAKNSA
jgi:hypothetical protein